MLHYTLAWSLEELVKTFAIEADDHRFADDDGRRAAAVVRAHQLAHRFRVAADVTVAVLNASLREVGLQRVARRSAGLGVGHDSLVGHAAPKTSRGLPRAQSAYSISLVIFAVFCSMAETEQYFSFERRTASSTAFFATLPLTV